jgi:hypothetical protein
MVACGHSVSYTICLVPKAILKDTGKKKKMFLNARGNGVLVTQWQKI